MDRKKKIDTIAIPSIEKTIRYIEWIAIATSAIAILFNGILLDNRPPLPRAFPDLVVLILVLCLAPLSSIFPIDRPLWQKRIYILLELVLILPTRLSEVNLELILFLIFAKASLLLNRKDVITIVILAGIVWLSIPIWLLTLPEVIEFVNSQRPSPTSSNNLILQYIINDFSVYLAASTFVILLSFVIVSERRSREKAIALAQEIDYLSAALERSRIARNIHDSLGHTLTTLDIQLELAQRLFDRNPDKAKHAIDDAKNLADKSLSDVRQSVQTMRSEDFNLDKAILILITQIKEHQNLAIDIDLNLPKLPSQIGYQLYCILQEGLTNIQKHSYASLVSIRGQLTPEGIIVKIEDNGRGFNPNRVHSGYGLLGMKERVDNLGGSLKIDSASDQGTCIQIKIPWDETYHEILCSV
jgi:signal transduction histidine kinase